MRFDSFSGKTVLITGASKGIGKEIARCLIDSDCRLILSASKISSFDEFDFKSDNMTFVPFDLADEQEISNALQLIRLRGLAPDIIINNAGIGIFKNLVDISIEDFDKMTKINYKAPFIIIKEFINDMIGKNFGVVANVASVAAINSFPKSSVYGSSKAALLEMMKTLRLETRKYNIKVLNILPGATETTIWADKVRNEFGHKMMQPNDLADTIVRLIDNSIANNLTMEEIIIRPQQGDL